MEDSVWTKLAISYDEVLVQWSLYQEIRDYALAGLSESYNICDIGCGSGIIASDLARMGKMVYGVDNNPHMLDRAKSKETEELKGRLNLKEGDALNLEFQDNTFDGVVSVNVIFYVESPEQLLKEAYRVLQQGKKLVIIGPKPNLDIEKIANHCYNEFAQKGILPEFKEHLDNMAKCNRMMKSEGQIKNTYEVNELEHILRKVGFSEIIKTSEHLYLGGSYAITVKK